MQIVCPIFGLACVAILRSCIMANADVLANLNIAVPVPFVYNIPLKPLSNFDSIIFNVTDCNEWYMYKFEDSVPTSDRLFFGSNPGTPLERPQSSGMLSSSGPLGQNVLTVPCKEAKHTVPYF